MFTGIVERVVEIRAVEPLHSSTGHEIGRRLVLSGVATASANGGVAPWSDLSIGESIAVSGVCLTLVDIAPDGALCFDVVPETLRVTTLGESGPGQRVNLERSLRVGDRLGGHFVTGHVDAVGRVRRREGGEETRLEVEVVRMVDQFSTIPKGSVAVDGVSLTVVDSAAARGGDPEWFSVALVPHTLAVTTLGHLAVGAEVNLEMDPIGKWVGRWAAATPRDRS
ncbi:MAG: riboflavin synthase [Planctomycetes bacterium]|nr:riboflavin synthase [Planctomycetota bacterium]